MRGQARKLRFAAFEVDFGQQELRKGGLRVRLEHKSFRILELLLREPGELVLREDLANHLWPGLHVGFERGLNTAMNKLRQVLGDSFTQCRYIETRSGLGYRFIAPVEEILPGRIDRHIDADVRQDYLKGRYFLGKMTDDDVHKGIAHFESALAQNPRYALAYAGLADAYSQIAVAVKAKEFAVLALSNDSGLAEAHVSLARTRMLFDHNWKGAQSECVRAIEIEPESADAHSCYGTLLGAMGSHTEALRESRLACTLDPLSLPAGAALAWTLYMAREFQQAVEHCWRMLILEPRLSSVQTVLGLSYEQLGSLEDAITEFENADACSSQQPMAIGSLGHAHARSGGTEQALAALARCPSPYWRSLIHVALGDHGSALGLLQKACEERDVGLLWLITEPRFDPLRSDLRFQALLDHSAKRM
jgi:DNA-binding winged helix-turn-helix (wHTH) protein